MKQKEKKLIQPQTGVRIQTLLGLLGEDLLRDLAQKLESDKWVIKLDTVTVFKLVLYSILEGNQLSLRTIALNYGSLSFGLLEKSALGNTTRHSSIRDRLVNIDVNFFKELYNKLLGQISQTYGEGKLHGIYDIKRYDSSMVSVFSHLIEGMKVGNTTKGKRQVKFTTEFTNNFEVRMRFSKNQSDLGEEVALRTMIQEQSHDAKSIIVFDKGLKSRETFCEFDKDNIQFVTRLGDKSKYKIIGTHKEVPKYDGKEEVQIVQDIIVQLYANGGKLVEKEFRLVEVEVKTGKNAGKKLLFLTNILSLSASEIAQIYRQRWDIEVFFRFVKQEMNLSHLVCNNLNAIQVMIYCTLIAAMLILIYKKKNEITSYKLAKKLFMHELIAGILFAFSKDEETYEQFRKTTFQYHSGHT